MIAALKAEIHRTESGKKYCKNTNFFADFGYQLIDNLNE
jgi:uncharacterized small protein (DUF1192 family)